MEGIDLLILGSNSAVPLADRSPTAQWLSMCNRRFLIDCGEGTQIKMRQHQIGFGRLKHIFISHLHGDHVYGLLPLLTTLHLLDRQQEMHLYGPPELETLLRESLKLHHARLRFPLVFHPTDPKGRRLMYEDEALTVDAFPLRHSLPCFGYLFAEKEKPRHMRKEQIERYEIPVAQIRQIKQGADYQYQGETIANAELTEPARPPLRYAFVTDTAPLLELHELLPPVDLLYHEATFTDEHAERASETFHSTAKQAATVARKIGAQRLLLGHFSVRYRDLAPLREEAQSIFTPSYLAEEGCRFQLHHPQAELKILPPKGLKKD